MFLSALSQETKIKFLELIYSIANFDGNYAIEEQEIVSNYQVELNMPVLPEITAGIDELMAYFAGQLVPVKKIVVFEIYRLILADSIISSQEQKILDLIDDTFGIDASTLAAIKDLVRELHDVYDKIYDVLG